MSKIFISNDFQAFFCEHKKIPTRCGANANYVSFFDEAITGYFKYVNYDYWTDIEETRKDFLSSWSIQQIYLQRQEIEIGTKTKK